MGPVSEFLDRVPYSRSILLIGLALAVVLARSCQLNSRESEIEKFQGAIDKRIAKVTASIDSLRVEDEGLLGCIRKAAMDRANIHPMSTGGIDDVRELQLLYCRNSGINSISGIGELARLTFVDLSRNNISSITPLNDHSHLKTLHIAQNPLSDIRVVRTLPALTEIYLPDLPKQSCRDIERLLQDVKSNYKTIECAGKAATVKTADARQKREEEEKRRRDRNNRLTAAQEEELLEYEQNERYRNR